MGRGGVVPVNGNGVRSPVNTNGRARGAVMAAPPGAVYSTGAVAGICGVATRTVSKWFDSGALPGYRLPGSSDRRIREADLVAFMRKAGFPIPGTLGGGCKVAVMCHVLVPGADPVDPVYAGVLAGRRELGTAVIGLGDGFLGAIRIARHLRDALPSVRLAVLLAEDRKVDHVPAGVFDASFQWDADPAAIGRWVDGR